jgi:YggT family protein
VEDASVLLSIGLQIIYLLVLVFLNVLLARFAMTWVMSLGRRWRPGRGAAATLELVWSVTDPPLKWLRRVIPPLRLGTVSVDLAFIVLLVIVFLLMYIVLPNLILLTS